jgi:mediator of RNA polymerase II transcription subunit 12, fungi type
MVSLQRVCLTLPDAYISPRTWTKHAALLNEVLASKILGPEGGSDQGYSRDIEQALMDNLSDIKRRNDAMMFCNLQPPILTQLWTAAADIQARHYISVYPSHESHSTVDSVSIQSQALAT